MLEGILKCFRKIFQLIKSNFFLYLIVFMFSPNFHFKTRLPIPKLHTSFTKEILFIFLGRFFRIFCSLKRNDAICFFQYIANSKNFRTTRKARIQMIELWYHFFLYRLNVEIKFRV